MVHFCGCCLAVHCNANYKSSSSSSLQSFISQLKMFSIVLALCFSLSSSVIIVEQKNVGSSCVNPLTLSFFENALTNISDQLKGSPSESITCATSLFQLSLLRDMIRSYKASDKSNAEGLALVKNIDARLSVIEKQVPSAISSLQSQVSSLSSDLKKVSQLLSKYLNVTLTEEASSSHLLPSCVAILSKWPSSPSGYYSLVDVNGHTRHVYCHMETLCGKGGGWRRIASLNMKNSNESCPTQFKTYSQGGVRACGRPTVNSGSCASVEFPSRDIKYSHVCGKVIGYQHGTPDGANHGGNINTYYADGIIFTHGSPRKHIWSLLSGYSDISYSNCPCANHTPRSVPSFVGSDYYCEAGCHSSYVAQNAFCTSDPLWDGKDCGSSETTCCKRALIPWFYKSIGSSTTDSIEMRVCCDSSTSDEDVSFEQYEIYVK